MRCCLIPISYCYGDNAKVRFQRPVVIIDRIDNSTQTDSPEEAAVDNDDVHVIEEQQNAPQVMHPLHMLSGEWQTLTTLDSPDVEIQDGIVIWNKIYEYSPTRLRVSSDTDGMDQVVMEIEGIQFQACIEEGLGRLVLIWNDGDSWLQLPTPHHLPKWEQMAQVLMRRQEGFQRIL